jgi:hypothetical protein
MTSDDARHHAAAQKLWLAHLRGTADPRASHLSAREWALFEDEATRHELRGLTYRLLADGPFADSVPPAVLERMRVLYLDTARRNALAFHETRRMVQALTRRGIEVVLLKGVHLARFAYAEPGLRNMADVDVMVRRERLAEAEQVYLAHGYGPFPRPDVDAFCTRSNHLAKLQKPGVPEVELHWSIERPTSPFHIDLDGVWDRSRPAALDGVAVRVLAPEDALLHLAVHASYHHRFDRAALKGLVDIQALVARHRDDLDWEAMTSRARVWGVAGFTYATLRLAKEILGVAVPASALTALPHAPEDERAVEVARRYILVPRPELPSAYLELGRSRTLGERWRHFLDHVFLPRTRIEQNYGLVSGSPLVYVAYVRRIGNLLLRRSGLFLRTLAGTEGVRAPLEREEDRRRLEHWTRGVSGSEHIAENGG